MGAVFRFAIGRDDWEVAVTRGEGTNADEEEADVTESAGRVVFVTGVFVDRATGVASLTGEGFVAGADAGGTE